MNLQDWAAIAVAVVTLLGGVTAMLQFMVKHYLAEMKPNSGSSMRDEIRDISRRVDALYELLLDRQ